MISVADLSRLSVGYELPALEVGPITRTTLELFASASGDDNPVHIDADAARAAGLDDVFAHGMLSMAYLGRLLIKWVPQERIHSFGVRFVAITPVDASPRCEGTVVGVDDGLAEVALRIVLADGTVTLTGSAVIDIS